MTGTIWIEESGFAEGPILLTNTHSVGLVRDASIKWQVRQKGKTFDPESMWSLPIVAETWDGYLNDINGFHVKDDHVFQALDGARGGAVQEGAVGGGTGMICYEFKGGIGTSSRKLDAKAGGYTVGVLVQCNCGRRPQLTIAGAPVGKEIAQEPAYSRNASPDAKDTRQDTGSIIILVATDAPLLPHQLKRLARRATMGLARTGSISGNGSGDLFLAFSTAARITSTEGVSDVRMLANDSMDPLFQATVQATEEAIVNAMVAAGTMTGVDGHRVIGLPHDQLVSVMKKYNRLSR
jgi:L-aminopeptidase/D-esterase-like protein